MDMLAANIIYYILKSPLSQCFRIWLNEMVPVTTETFQPKQILAHFSYIK